MKTQTEILYDYMKRTCYTILCLTALTLAPVLAQAQPGTTTLNVTTIGGGGMTDAAPLVKFNLDFPGGTPRELVAAIAKASGRPLNAIVPNDYADWPLPALKMESVDVAQLFKALELASHKQERIGNTPYSSSYGFWTEGNPSANSIWSFNVSKPLINEKLCRFYSLAPYLDRGLSVDDITTAIETGWKMMGDTSPPTISFHKDTKLLIAVGEESKLDTIADVLKALEQPMTGRRGGGFGGGGFQPTPRTNAPAPAAK
jgi:hypothetical protein